MGKAIVEKKVRIGIVLISVLIPVIVAALIFLPFKTGLSQGWVYWLPHLNAMMNSLTILFLVSGFVAIKKGKVEIHKKAMVASFVLGSLFLVSYLIYHSSADSTLYGDFNRDGVVDDAEKIAVGGFRLIYLVILLTHILLAIVVAPLVLTALVLGLTGNFQKHRKIARYAYPVWLYVSVTGVVVYFMIKPFYPV